jgi:hypothetical protein
VNEAGKTCIITHIRHSLIDIVNENEKSIKNRTIFLPQHYRKILKVDELIDKNESLRAKA